jgi:hypothetical protein
MAPVGLGASSLLQNPSPLLEDEPVQHNSNSFLGEARNWPASFVHVFLFAASLIEGNQT